MPPWGALWGAYRTKSFRFFFETYLKVLPNFCENLEVTYAARFALKTTSAFNEATKQEKKVLTKIFLPSFLGKFTVSIPSYCAYDELLCRGSTLNCTGVYNRGNSFFDQFFRQVEFFFQKLFSEKFTAGT